MGAAGMPAKLGRGYPGQEMTQEDQGHETPGAQLGVVEEHVDVRRRLAGRGRPAGPR